MKKSFCTILAILLVMCLLTGNCFSYFKADGNISHEEIIHSKVQSLCNNAQSGNSLSVLNSFYNNSTSDKIIYLGLNGDFGGKEIDKEKVFQIIVSIENNPKIKIGSDGKIEFDEQYFLVNANTRIMYSSFKSEFKIIYKFPMSNSPKISVQIIDTDGLNSRMFDINTNMPEETTMEETTRHEETKPKETDTKVSKKGMKTKKSSAKNDDDEESTQVFYDSYHSDSSNMVLDSNIEKESENSEANKVLFVSISAGLLTAIIFTLIFINIKYLISKEKDKKKEKENKQ